MKKRTTSGRFSWVSELAIVLAGVAVLAMPREAAQGTAAGLELCMTVVIPSLFMLMFVSILVVETGVAERVGVWLAPVTRRLFGLPGAAGAALLLAVTGGYPAGAKAVRGLYERGAITADEAACMAGFCFSAGPAFLIGTVGVMLMSDVAAGLLLLGVQLAVVPLMGVLSRLLRRPTKRAQEADMPEDEAVPPRRSAGDIGTAVVASARQAASALLSVCLFVIIFSAVRAMLQTGVTPTLVWMLTAVGLSERAAAAVIPILLEVTGGCAAAAPCGLPVVAFAAGFGGISVHLQVFSMLGSECVRKGSFFVMRLIQGAVSALLTALALICLPDRVFAAAASPAPAAALSGSVTGAATLLVMCVMCLLCLPSARTQPVYSRDSLCADTTRR